MPIRKGGNNNGSKFEKKVSAMGQAMIELSKDVAVLRDRADRANGKKCQNCLYEPRWLCCFSCIDYHPWRPVKGGDIRMKWKVNKTD